MSDVVHALSEALQAAADGRFPAVDGLAEVHPPDDSGTHAVVEFTGHAFVLTDAIRRPRSSIGERTGSVARASRICSAGWPARAVTIGSHDAVLVARGTGATAVQRRSLPGTISMLTLASSVREGTGATCACSATNVVS